MDAIHHRNLETASHHRPGRAWYGAPDLGKLPIGPPFRVVDTNTYAVTVPARPAPPPPAAAAGASRPGGGVPWAWAVPAAIALLETDVTLGILPFGSYMNIANGLGIPLKPIDAARVIAERKVKRSDVGEVAGKVFFETCGIGIDADMFGAARLAERRRWGPAFRRIVRWATAKTHRVEITVDGKTERHRVLQILVVNSPYYGWAMPVVPNAHMTDGELDVAIFPRKGRLELLGWMAKIWRTGRPGKPPRVLRGKVIEIRSSEAIPVHADGQIAGRLPVTVRCCEGALRVFA